MRRVKAAAPFIRPHFQDGDVCRPARCAGKPGRAAAGR
jgi:hypothetical protein